MSDTARPSGEIVALVPAYNEARHIADVIGGAAAHLPVLVVDDGSTDDTARIAREAGASVLVQSPNAGKGAALRAGMRWALERETEAIVTLDADGQHDAAEIPLFLDALTARRPDLIIGARDFSSIPSARRVANTLGRWSLSWALGEQVLDNQSGYRLIGRELMTALIDSPVGGFEFEVEMILVCRQMGLTLEWVPIRTIYGDEESHINGLDHTIGYTRMVLRARRAMKAARANP